MPHRKLNTILSIVFFMILLFVVAATSFYLSIDNSCKRDKPSLEKRCLVAIEYYRGR